MFDYIIVDEWYENPDNIRKLAIERIKEYPKNGEENENELGFGAFPGTRGKSSIDNLIFNRKKIEEHIEFNIDPEKWIYISSSDCNNYLEKLEFNFNNFSMYVKGTDLKINTSNGVANGAFQYCNENSTKWIHSDYENNYAAVVYLTPNAPEGTGTSFYKNKSTNSEFDISGIPFSKEECMDFDRWEEVKYLENVYNRCIIFNAKRYHSAKNYFGNSIENGRLFQVFFFDLKD
jgi:hypothetical protein